MKTMTCRQLGGACEEEFHAGTFEDMASQSKEHGMEMIRKGDEAHIRAMNDLQSRMSSPEMMNAWFEGRRREFEKLPKDE
ncbi:hypothetical protein [Salinimicrobium xinjiangense]|uniref:hypothetical protein n=1 Tax=Salinimicrobium xinjiangense TaxID=438596 RepID=UPI0003FB1E4F|nr:hypothetical protein [Salinimicrobium xinjiangense]